MARVLRGVGLFETKNELRKKKRKATYLVRKVGPPARSSHHSRCLHVVPFRVLEGMDQMDRRGRW